MGHVVVEYGTWHGPHCGFCESSDCTCLEDKDFIIYYYKSSTIFIVVNIHQIKLITIWALAS